MSLIIKTEVLENPENHFRPYCVYTVRGKHRLRCFKNESTAKAVSRTVSIGADVFGALVAIIGMITGLQMTGVIDLKKGIKKGVLKEIEQKVDPEAGKYVRTEDLDHHRFWF